MTISIENDSFIQSAHWHYFSTDLENLDTPGDQLELEIPKNFNVSGLRPRVHTDSDARRIR